MLDEPGGILVVNLYAFDTVLRGGQLGRGLPPQRRAEYLIALPTTLRKEAPEDCRSILFGGIKCDPAFGVQGIEHGIVERDDGRVVGVTLQASMTKRDTCQIQGSGIVSDELATSLIKANQWLIEAREVMSLRCRIMRTNFCETNGATAGGFDLTRSVAKKLFQPSCHAG
ncbi:hypothetical protein A3Q37_05345 [Streptomyces sp. PTY087I2]|nr:hypothetical protein A3Q37_05345 [Streptomyces sp. PTY087I2]